MSERWPNHFSNITNPLRVTVHAGTEVYMPNTENKMCKKNDIYIYYIYIYIYIYITLDHKTSLKCQFFEIDLNITV